MNFTTAVDHIFNDEGLYSDHAADRGGATKYGVTIHTLRRHRGREVSKEDVQALTVDEALTIYHAFYWEEGHCPDLPPQLRYFHFDSCVQHGTGGALRILQRAAGTVDDGLWGPKTEKATSLMGLGSYAVERSLYYMRIIGGDHSQAVFANGWANRLEKVYNRAKHD